MLNDPLANLFSNLLNAEKQGKNMLEFKPSSNLIKNVLVVLKNNNFVGSFKEVEDGRGNFLQINLLGNINKCNATKPRLNVKHNGYEHFEKRFLPAKGFGFLLVSTSKGIFTHQEAIEKKLGGTLLGYCY
jgi:small subunit ribosomal protein S8